jgi:hypothetical protein
MRTGSTKLQTLYKNNPLLGVDLKVNYSKYRSHQRGIMWPCPFMGPHSVGKDYNNNSFSVGPAPG